MTEPKGPGKSNLSQKATTEKQDEEEGEEKRNWDLVWEGLGRCAVVDLLASYYLLATLLYPLCLFYLIDVVYTEARNNGIQVSLFLSPSLPHLPSVLPNA